MPRTVMQRSPILLTLLVLASLLLGDSRAVAQPVMTGSPVLGHWDLTVHAEDGDYPAWLEVEKSGVSTLVGRYVGPSGSARPVAEIALGMDSTYYHFSIPPQWSDRRSDLEIEFRVAGEELEGWTTEREGEVLTFTGARAPALRRNEEPAWGAPVALLDSASLDGWHVVGGESQWTVEGGVLKNRGSGGNLVTDRTFEDFKLHVEFKYPEGSNSGVYLRGRYEVQVVDSYGEAPESHLLGGVYGFLDPSVNVAKEAGAWQSFDITLVGRMVTVELNGTTVICNRAIPGITGGALDSQEDAPGPLMLQGDHGRVEYRHLRITPAQ